MSQESFDSTDDARVGNSPVRHRYRELSDVEKRQMSDVKDWGAGLIDMMDNLGGSRELSIAKTKTEEAVMWAVKHITGPRK